MTQCWWQSQMNHSPFKNPSSNLCLNAVASSEAWHTVCVSIAYSLLHFEHMIDSTISKQSTPDEKLKNSWMLQVIEPTATPPMKNVWMEKLSKLNKSGCALAISLWNVFMSSDIHSDTYSSWRQYSDRVHLRQSREDVVLSLLIILWKCWHWMWVCRHGYDLTTWQPPWNTR